MIETHFSNNVNSIYDTIIIVKVIIKQNKGLINVLL